MIFCRYKWYACRLTCTDKFPDVPTKLRKSIIGGAVAPPAPPPPPLATLVCIHACETMCYRTTHSFTCNALSHKFCTFHISLLRYTVVQYGVPYGSEIIAWKLNPENRLIVEVATFEWRLVDSHKNWSRATLLLTPKTAGGGWINPPPRHFARPFRRANFFDRAARWLFTFKSRASYDTIFAKIGHTVTMLHNLLYMLVRPKMAQKRDFVYKVNVNGVFSPYS